MCVGRVRLAICTVWGRRRGNEDAGAIPLCVSGCHDRGKILSWVILYAWILSVSEWWRLGLPGAARAVSRPPTSYVGTVRLCLCAEIWSNRPRGVALGGVMGRPWRLPLLDGGIIAER